MDRRSYGTDFEELERLGGGGQGSVYKVTINVVKAEVWYSHDLKSLLCLNVLKYNVICDCFLLVVLFCL